MQSRRGLCLFAQQNGHGFRPAGRRPPLESKPFIMTLNNSHQPVLQHASKAIDWLAE
jgi:hypothetical protein